jgi:hypothetical protein
MIWARDWVYRVIAPFLTQIKNRLANIKLEKLDNGKLKFTNAENVSEEFANIGTSNIQIVTYTDVNSDFTSEQEVTTENLLAYLVSLNNTDSYLNSFITIQDIPIAVSSLDGNLYEGKPLFFFKKEGDTYEILEIYKKDTSNRGLVLFKTNVWSNILKFQVTNYEKESRYGGTFLLSLSSMHGSFVYHNKFEIAVTHPKRVNVVTIHDKLYGDIQLQIFLDNYGNGYIKAMPLTGSDEANRTVVVQVDNFVGDTYKIGFTENIDENTYSLVFNSNTSKLGINTQVKQAKQEALTGSKDSEGCVNINPFFELGSLDYEPYAENPIYGEIIQDDVYKYTNALSIKKHGTIIGTTKIPIVPGRDYRASIAMKVYTDYNKSVNPNEEVSIYVGVCCYDSDNNIIYPHNLPIAGAPWGELVEDFKQGDTYIKVKMTDGSPYNGGVSHKRSFLLYRADDNFSHIGNNGRIYDPRGYTRNYFYQAYNINEVIDEGNDVYRINLKNAYDGSKGEYKIGDAFTNTRSGGSFNYWISNKKFVADGKWHTYSNNWRRYPKGYIDPALYTQVVRNGTAYVRLLILPNYRYFKEDGTKTYDVNLETILGQVALEWRRPK